MRVLASPRGRGGDLVAWGGGLGGDREGRHPGPCSIPASLHPSPCSFIPDTAWDKMTRTRRGVWGEERV